MERVRWRNGMVLVFDERGEQMPEYQGQYEEVRERIVQEFPEERWEAHGQTMDWDGIFLELGGARVE